MYEEGPATLAGGLRFCPLVLDGILTEGEIPHFARSRLLQADRGCPRAFLRRGAPAQGGACPPGFASLSNACRAAGSSAGGRRPLHRAPAGQGLPPHAAMKVVALGPGALLSRLRRALQASSPRPPSSGGRAADKEPGERAAARGLLIALPGIGEEAAAEGGEAAGIPRSPALFQVLLTTHTTVQTPERSQTHVTGVTGPVPPLMPNQTQQDHLPPLLRR
ncbi:uncharacterized protein LOC134552913 [Prinia subflava]|uniref:uncharacterized protein LOC134552913 n=1 Tax=Prinia subflava TaxID=208062 RepID=UPI002FE277B0